MSKDEEKSKKRQPHPGSVVPDDAALSTWLHRFWARTEPPERIELWQMFGRNPGERIFHEVFKAGEKLDAEQANKLGNEMIEAAQHDCDSQPSHARRERTYQIKVIDRNKGAAPLVRALGPLQPKRTFITAAGGNDGGDGDPYDDESLEGLTLQRLGLAYTKEQFGQIRWEKGRTDQIISQLFLWMSDRGERTEKRLDMALDRIMSFFEKLQEAEDRRATRDIMVMKEKLKIELLSDGAKSVKNLLPGLFAAAKEDGAAARILAGNSSNDSGSSNGNGHNSGRNSDEKKDYGASPERDLVDNFLTDIERANLDSKLFGEIDEAGGKQTVEGIFSLKQLAILVGVHQGRLPASELDKLLPKSGHDTAITEEQINKAGEAGVTLGMGTALMEIVGLRTRAREAKAQEQVHDAEIVDNNPITDAP